jgi:phenylalanyl-tRNA synthetase beta subunit
MDPEEGTMTETLNSITISTKFQRIAERAREAPELAFNTLAHLLTKMVGGWVLEVDIDHAHLRAVPRKRVREMAWERFDRLLKRFPPPQARIVHPVYLAANP